MELDTQELREQIIRPTLQYLGKDSDAAENLLIALAQLNQHSLCRQNKAYGIYQIDAALHQRIWNKYLAFEPDLASKIRGLASQREFLNNPHTELTTNLAYATAIAWAIHLAFPQSKHPCQQTPTDAAGKEQQATGS
ncbi:hypothetical protein [Bacterioplanoides sp. SCSIO 12839]|uniref:hypothetical protein n=1 Tax=Bacterioplanoides sp. SCSIO 12839 TaxID=2829569 RepID=UPI0021024D35|nr:hypothetical protein [Bacterioplanoides sp. SCSIO 12839]UTW49396.1 hypothetical protein KFF03_05710 [Bacterioplanoides sp. SCSIO 12839]